MHGGFGGGGGGGHSGGGGGYGHSGSGGGHHSGGGGGHHSGGGHHGGQANPTAIASHNLGGSSQSILGHIAALGQNPQGVLGAIASWLTGQHQVSHHAAGAAQQTSQQHIGDVSWTSSGLQVEKSRTWKERMVKMPAIQIMMVFLVIAGWLAFLMVLRHGDAEHTAKSPMPTQSEWRQQLTGNGSGEQGGEVATDAPAQASFGQAAPNVSMFGMPRDVEGAVPPNLSNYVQQAYVVTAAPAANGQSSYGAQSAPSMAGYAAPVQSPNPAAQLGRRSFSARVALANPDPSQQAQPASSSMAGDLYAPIESRRGFHHRVIADR